MAKKKLKLNLNLDLSGIQAQFQGLQGRHPGLWPILPRVSLMVGLIVVILTSAYFLYWQGLLEELETGRQQEETLKTAFVDKMKQAVNLEVLRKQKEQVKTYVGLLEKQLPSKAEMDALLSDINQAGVGRGLQFNLFRPRTVAVKDYYAELPIDLRLTGNYHDIGAFTSDLSNLPRIVTLNNLQVNLDQKTGKLTMDTVAKTFRYLDDDEVAAQKAALAAKNKPAGAAK